MPLVTLKQLLEAGVHFGHQTSRWNPKMKRYIFTARNGIHIIDLQQTVKLLDDASNWVKDIVGGGRLVLFIGTKKQAQESIELEARRSGMPFVNHRWMGGMLTNFTVMRRQIERLNSLRAIRNNGGAIRAVKLITSKIADAALEARQLISPEELAAAPEAPVPIPEYADEEEEAEEDEKGFAGMPTIDEAEFYEDEALDDEK